MNKHNQFFAVYGYITPTQQAVDDGTTFEIDYSIWGRAKDEREEEWVGSTVNHSNGTASMYCRTFETFCYQFLVLYSPFIEKEMFDIHIEITNAADLMLEIN